MDALLHLAPPSYAKVGVKSCHVCFLCTPLALSASGGTQRLPRLVGEAKAKELIFTARVLSGEEAAEIGLAEYAVPPNEAGDAAFQKALEIAKEIAKKVTLCDSTY